MSFRCCTPVSSERARRILGIADLTDAEIDALVVRAGELADGAAPESRSGVLGVAMFETSLRTRTGFAAAAYRLGMNVIDVDARRASEVSMPESIADTVRTLSGYADALVVRAPVPAAETDDAVRPDRPWLNAGDRGESAEHPSQALIDLFAIERLAGPVEHQHIAAIGDLRARSARSLLAMLARRPPRSITLVTDESLTDGFELPAELEPFARFGSRTELADADVLLAVGIPHGATTEPVRSRLRIDRSMLAGVPDDAIVLSPMPIIDEIASPARRDPRMRYFEQSDLGLLVRMALLEALR